MNGINLEHSYINLEYIDTKMLQLPPEYEIPAIATKPALPSSTTVSRPSPNIQPSDPVAPQRIRIGFFGLTPPTLDLIVFTRNLLDGITDKVVRISGLTAQFIPIMVLLSQTPALFIVLGVAAFAFGLMEAGMVFWFAYRGLR
jgi:hypothetical protein